MSYLHNETMQTITIDEKHERKSVHERLKASEIGESEVIRLYLSDGRLARKSAQEVVQHRNIEGVQLEDISPNAAWKEAVFRFRTRQKMLPESFCQALAVSAWQKYVDFCIQKKQNLRIRVVLKFTYPNEDGDAQLNR